MKFNDTLMLCVRRDLDNGLIPMLLGEPGIGKSSWLTNLANLMHTKCFTLACNQLADKADLTGARLIPTDNGEYKQVFYPHAVIHDAIEYAIAHPRETPILFLDELNRTTPDVTSEALSIPTLRSIGSKDLPSNLRVVIAGNDKGNVTSLDEASVSRFVLYRVAPDTNTFLSLDPNLNIFVKNVLQAHPECIFCKKLVIAASSGKPNNDDDDDDDVGIDDILEDGDDMAQITTPRTLSGVSTWLNSFTNQELMALLTETHIEDGVEVSALQEAIEGHVGRTNFSTFLLAEIANGITRTNNQSNALTIGKPACYDAMKKCTNMTKLNDFVATMSDNDKSGCLLYTLYEKADNGIFINALAKNMTSLVSADMKTLMKLANMDMLDGENAHALLATNSPISNALTVILEMAI